MTTTDTQRTGPEPKCATCGHGTLSHNAIGGACTKCECGHFKPAKNEARCLRPGCGRTLKSAKSVAAGYGPVCARKIREAALTEARADFSDKQQASADQLIRDGGAVEIAPGLYEVTSSDGEHTYACDGHSCVCDAGWADKRCYHLLAVRILSISARPAQSRTAFRTAA